VYAKRCVRLCALVCVCVCVRAQALLAAVCVCMILCVCVDLRLVAWVCVRVGACTHACGYGVAMVSRIDKITGRFCRVLSLL